MMKTDSVKIDSGRKMSFEDISIIEIAYFLWRYKILILSVAVGFSIVGAIYTFFAPEIFSTRTVFITKTAASSNSNLSNLASMAGLSLGGNNNTDPSDYLDQVIQDKNFLSELLRKKWKFWEDSLYLDEIWKLKKDTLRANWKYAFEMGQIEFIRNNGVLSVSKDRKSGILTLTTKAPDPQLAYDLNSFCIDKIGAYIRNSIKSQAKEKRIFIEKRIEEVKSDLDKSENLFVKFKERNIASVSPQVTIEEMRLTRNVSMNQEIYIQYRKQYELACVEEKNDQTLVQIIINPEVPVFRTSPKRKQAVVVAFAIGLFLGIMIAFPMFVFSKSVK